MWFTRVSIANPVMAVMVMLAFVVLGVFSYQRLAVDQLPNIDFPTVVVQLDYPGASPEIVESDVTRKVEEAVNTRHARTKAPRSSSSSSTSTSTGARPPKTCAKKSP
jgi:multidrug efflux pump subunit AcrB